MKKFKKTTSFFIVATLIAIGYLACGNKTSLDPPAPLRVEKIESVDADIQCEKVILSFSPALFDNRGNPLNGSIKYLVLRRRGDQLKESTPTPTPTVTTPANESLTPTINATSTPSSTPLPIGVKIEDTEFNNSPTPTTSPTLIPQPQYEYRLIGIIEEKAINPLEEQLSAQKIKFEDTGKTGIVFSPQLKF